MRGLVAPAQTQGLASVSGELSYHGGAVLNATAPYLIFWLPSGESLPSGSESLITRYFTDVAADSGTATNVFGVDRQYYDATGIADYAQTFSAGHVIVDTTPYPVIDSKSCPDVNATYYPKCLTDAQLQTEIANVIGARGLPLGTGTPTPIYFLVTPADVNVCADGSDCADNAFCSYHSAFDDGGSSVLYAAIPFFLSSNPSDSAQYAKSCQNDGNAAIQEPNGNLADVAISYMSHEDNETITDPFGTGWWDNGTGNEEADNCQSVSQNGQSFEPTLGGSSTAGTLYDQVINGDPYYTQDEWSNGDAGCEMRPTPQTITPQFTTANGDLTPAFDPSATISTSSITSASWSFGDGTAAVFESGSAALDPVTHTYAAPGRYTVTLVLVDNRGNVATTSETVPIGSLPVAAIGYSPAEPIAGTAVSFNSAGTFDLDAGVSIASYTWDFGDGAMAAGPAPSHTYTAPGTYQVALTAANSLGLMRTAFSQLTVARIRVVKVSIRKHRYGAVIRFTVNGPCTLSVGHRTATAAAAGTKRLAIWLSRAQLRALRNTHHLRIRIRIHFAPRFGPPSKFAVTINFRR